MTARGLLPPQVLSHGIALRKDRALLLAGYNRSAGTDFCEEGVWIEHVLVCHNYPLALGIGAAEQFLGPPSGCDHRVGHLGLSE
jgi:hypothetical protein